MGKATAAAKRLVLKTVRCIPSGRTGHVLKSHFVKQSPWAGVAD